MATTTEDTVSNASTLSDEPPSSTPIPLDPPPDPPDESKELAMTSACLKDYPFGPLQKPLEHQSSFYNRTDERVIWCNNLDLRYNFGKVHNICKE